MESGFAKNGKPNHNIFVLDRSHSMEDKCGD